MKTKPDPAELLRAAEPLITWMRKNAHPHCTVIVDGETVELLEGIAIGRANPARDSTIAQPEISRAPSLESIQRTLELQAEQIRALASVLYQHDMIRQRDLDQFEPRKEGGAS